MMYGFINLRYTAIKFPITYQNIMAHQSPWKRSFRFLWPVAFFAFAMASPLAFEASVVSWESEQEAKRQFIRQLRKSMGLNQDNLSVHNQTEVETESFGQLINENLYLGQYIIKTTEMRFNYFYVLIFKTIATFTITILIPFLLLAYYNLQIIRVLKHRARLRDRPANQSEASRTAKQEEARRAKVILYALTPLFACCHIPTFILGVHDCYNLDKLKMSIEHGCLSTPFWAMVVSSLSYLSVTLYSSLCCTLYCVCSHDFRTVLMKKIKDWRQRYFSRTQDVGVQHSLPQTGATSVPDENFAEGLELMEAGSLEANEGREAPLQNV